MRQMMMAVALLTCCLAISGCGGQRIQVPIPIPDDKMDCADLERDQDGNPVRPSVPPEYVIDWSGLTTVGEAREEHEAFVTRVRERERPVAIYIVELEGRVFACASDDTWLRDYTSRLPDSVN